MQPSESLLYDLHAHSSVSDGTLAPEDLVARAVKQEVDVIALTDHDTTDGLGAARNAASKLEIGFVPGVEISVTWNGGTIHVLGLGINEDNNVLQSGLSTLREFRVWRAQEIARRLEKKGVENALDGASQFAQGALISRTHFAHYLVKSGYAKDVRDVFRKFLVTGKPGHVPGQWASLQDAVNWIVSAGGQAVIAHPARYRLTATRLRQLLSEFKNAGGTGLEVVSSSHSQSDCMTMGRYAKQFDLLASRGSDFHGPEQPWVELGKIPALPEECQPIWSTWS